MTCSCAFLSRLTVEAAASLPGALQAALDRRMGAESLNSLAKRLGVRKEALSKHRDGCLRLVPAHRRKRINPNGSIVYFVQHGSDGPVKIGFTTQRVRERVHTLQIGNPIELRLLAVYPGGAAEERELHRDYDHLRIGRSEWFQPHPELLLRAAVCAGSGLEPEYPPGYEDQGLPSPDDDLLPILERFLELAA